MSVIIKSPALIIICWRGAVWWIATGTLSIVVRPSATRPTAIVGCRATSCTPGRYMNGRRLIIVLITKTRMRWWLPSRVMGLKGAIAAYRTTIIRRIKAAIISN
jgi:hypothetical protein